MLKPQIVHFLLGGAEFEEDEEYLQFQFRFLYILMLNGLVFNSAFLLSDGVGLVRLGSAHLIMTQAYSLISLLLMVLVWGRKNRFTWVAWSYVVLNFLQFVSALLFVTADEMRVVWFFLQISGVYILLGAWPGMFNTLATILAIHTVNPNLQSPLSTHALATLTLSLGAAGVVFHVYSSRSVSFHRRMVESNVQLRKLSTEDPLTGLLNARAYYALVDKLIRLASRNDTSFAVLFIDLDHFKSINDRYGHEAGDRVLKETAACLARLLRHSDALGRIGGEEFSIFLSNITQEEALRFAEKVRGDIEQRMPRIEETPLRITASIGVAMSQSEPRTFAEIQGEADQAMYRAKAAGRNRVTLFDGKSQAASRTD
ncbi:MAG: GGDEF domain-containing protein [Magnetococcales bacterium]|nr:GGDEF domain-containing protein [Magnetococcales bacterium]